MHFAGCGDFWWKLAFCREQDLERLERENLSVAQCSDFQVQRQWSSTHHKVPDVMLMESLCSILCNSVALCLQENRRWHGCHPIKTEAWNDNKPRKGERGAVCLQMLLQRCWSSLNWWRIIWHKSQHQWQMILYFYILLFVSICFYMFLYSICLSTFLIWYIAKRLMFSRSLGWIWQPKSSDRRGRRRFGHLGKKRWGPTTINFLVKYELLDHQLSFQSWANYLITIPVLFTACLPGFFCRMSWRKLHFIWKRIRTQWAPKTLAAAKKRNVWLRKIWLYRHR